MGRPLVATADVHYLRTEDYHHHAALLCVQTKSTLAQPKMTFDTNEFYLKSSEEMAESFGDVAGGAGQRRWRSPSAATSRSRSAAADPALRLPRRPDRGATTCAQLVDAGLRERYGDPLARRGAVERMEMELGVIGKMGFNAYFLIVWDFVNYAKANGIAVGPGRGSAAGSIVAYCAARSRTSTRCATTCCSSASSTPSACRCRTSTSTSRSAAASA